jgi:hypothetical protein
VLQVEGVERIPRGPHSHAMVAPPALVRQPPNSDTGRGLAISPVATCVALPAELEKMCLTSLRCKCTVSSQPAMSPGGSVTGRRGT